MSGRTLEEIEALAAEATPGPWSIKRDSYKGEGRTVVREVTFGEKIGRAWIQDSAHVGIDGLSVKEVIANAKLIASVPDLLRIAMAQKKEITRLKKRIGTKK